MKLKGEFCLEKKNINFNKYTRKISRALSIKGEFVFSMCCELRSQSA